MVSETPSSDVRTYHLIGVPCNTRDYRRPPPDGTPSSMAERSYYGTRCFSEEVWVLLSVFSDAFVPSNDVFWPVATWIFCPRLSATFPLSAILKVLLLLLVSYIHPFRCSRTTYICYPPRKDINLSLCCTYKIRIHCFVLRIGSCVSLTYNVTPLLHMSTLKPEKLS